MISASAQEFERRLSLTERNEEILVLVVRGDHEASEFSLHKVDQGDDER